MDFIDKLKTFIATVEGCKLTCYLDSVGIKTIGYGHVDSTLYEGMTITQEEADDLLKKDLQKFINILNLVVKVPLNDNQKIALISLMYNIGENNFKRSSVLSLLNAGNYKGACEHFSLWIKASGYTLPGLVSRRKKEEILFNTLQ